MFDLTELHENAQLQSLGFRFTSQPAGLVGQIAVGGASIAVTADGNHLRAKFLPRGVDEGGSFDLLLDGSPGALVQLAERYVVPGRPAPGPLDKGEGSGVAVLGSIQAARQGTRPVQPLRPDVKHFRRFLACGDFSEAMVAFENQMTFIPWLSRPIVAQATGTQGLISQQRTRFSASLFGIERTMLERQGWFVLDVQHPSIAWQTDNVLAELRAPLWSRLASLPADVPVDVVHAIGELCRGLGLQQQGNLLASVEDLVAASHTSPRDWLPPLLATVASDQFDAIIAPLFEREDDYIHNLATIGAIHRELGRATLERALASRRVTDRIKSAAQAGLQKLLLPINP